MNICYGKRGQSMFVVQMFAVIFIVFVLFTFYFIISTLKQDERKEILTTISVTEQTGLPYLLQDFLSTNFNESNRSLLVIDILPKIFTNISLQEKLRITTEKQFAGRDQYYAFTFTMQDKTFQIKREDWIPFLPISQAPKTSITFVSYKGIPFTATLALAQGCALNNTACAQYASNYGGGLPL